MKSVCMFEAVDGQTFYNEMDCIKHDQDCIGVEFDALLLTALQGDERGNVTRNDQYVMCLHLLKNRKEVLPILQKLVSYIEDEQVEEDE